MALSSIRDMVFQPAFDPVAHSPGLSAVVAMIPLLVLFVLLGVFRVRAQWAALAALAAALLIAVLAYGMPVLTAGDAALEGAAFGLFPIMWIVVNAIWIYNMTVVSGHFDVLRRSICSISPDTRIQAVVIAFCFGALLEALAGFGTPVAITSVMLIALGFRPVKAASVALVANTAPVAFGALAAPITTLAKLTNQPVATVGAMVGRQTPLLALIVPLILVFIVDGRRGVRQAWLPAVVIGVVFALGQFGSSNYLSVELADIVASLAATAAAVLLLRWWRPATAVTGDAGGGETVAADGAAGSSTRSTADPGAAGTGTPVTAVEDRVDTGPPADRRQTVLAYAPYLVIIAIFAVAQIGPVKALLAKTTTSFAWPGLHVRTPSGTPASAVTYKLDWLTSAGSLLLISGLIVAPILGIGVAGAVRAYGRTLHQLGWAIFTVASVLALAYVMNLSGQTITIGHWAAGIGTAFAFVSPILGWLGVAVTGSDTSSNALFGTLQVAAAKGTGLSPLLLAAANSSGGVLGKMISPQNLAIATAATGLAGREGDLFRRVVGWAVVLVLGMCVLVALQATPVLSWMVP